MLNVFFWVEGYVVVQVVEVVFVVGVIGDIGSVSFMFCWCWQVGYVDVNCYVQEFKQWVVIFGVMLGQIVVDGYYVNVFVGQCVEVCWQGCGQGFIFIGMYFGDVVIVKYYIVQQLDVEVVYVEYVFIGFVNDGESFRDQVFQCFVFFQVCVEFSGFCFQFVIREFFYCWFYVVDDIDDFVYMMQCMVVMVVENFG